MSLTKEYRPGKFCSCAERLWKQQGFDVRNVRFAREAPGGGLVVDVHWPSTTT